MVVKKVKCLGHVIRDDLRDDDDVQRGRMCGKLYGQANMLARKKHSDFLENHASLKHQISSVRSARKTDQPREISCNYVVPFDCYPHKPVFECAK